jgi:hypothetical protein
VARVWVADTSLAQPFDTVLDLVGSMTEDHDDLVDPSLANRVENVLEERPTLELGERFRRTEAGRRAGRQDEGGDGHPAAAVCVAG